MLWWNKALWLSATSHVTNFRQLKCFISAKIVKQLYVDSLAVLFYGPNSASFLFIFVFQTQIYKKTVGLSGIRTLIVGVEGKHADHLTTTTTTAQP